MDCFRLRSLSFGGQVFAIARRNDGSMRDLLRLDIGRSDDRPPFLGLFGLVFPQGGGCELVRTGYLLPQFEEALLAPKARLVRLARDPRIRAILPLIR